MDKLIIFGGTSEGRELAEWSAEKGFTVILCVATDYGEALCSPSEHLFIKKGRMNALEMVSFFVKEDPCLIIDATHPHAALVSENIREAAEKADLKVMRVVRPDAGHFLGDEYSEWEKDSLFYVSSAAEAVKILSRDDDPVLLTTGSKEFPEFISLKDFSSRVYARVIPQKDAISACEMAGLGGRHIIAMQGPFSQDLNLALIKSLGVKWLVTKESGEAGGYPEKIEAAAEAGIKAIVISRPLMEKGQSLEEVKDALLDLKKKEDSDIPPQITLIGMGMGGGSQLTVESLEAISEASVIFGAKRMINDIRPYMGDTPVEFLYKAEDVLACLDENPQYKKACVIFSGDTGFYSGCADFSGIIKEQGPLGTETEKKSGPHIKILPGVSSFSCLCARFGLREEEYFPASAHGRDADILSLLKDHEKVFLLLDKKTTIGRACRELTGAGMGDAFIYAGIRLGYKDEELLSGRAGTFTERDGDELAVMAIVKEEKDFA